MRVEVAMGRGTRTRVRITPAVDAALSSEDKEHTSHRTVPVLHPRDPDLKLRMQNLLASWIGSCRFGRDHVANQAIVSSVPWTALCMRKHVRELAEPPSFCHSHE